MLINLSKIEEDSKDAKIKIQNASYLSDLINFLLEIQFSKSPTDWWSLY